MTLSKDSINAPVLLGVNIDHIATLRQARGTRYPDPVYAALEAEQAGADGITLHLREDRRHIQDEDVWDLKNRLQTRMNLELAITEEMLAIAEKLQPEHVCFVPERREELTTEGGLDVIGQMDQVKQACDRLGNTSQVSLFIDPDIQQIDAAKKAGAPAIEIHTGQFAEAKTDAEKNSELLRVYQAVEYAYGQDLIVNAGHGLNIHNVQAVAAIPHINELNIGHSIIARSVFVGLKEAVKEIKVLIAQASKQVGK